MGLLSKKEDAAQNEDVISPGDDKATDMGMEMAERDAEVGAQPEAEVHARIDPEMEKRVRRKLDWHIIPLVSALYLLAFLDRSNIG